ncbi:transglutaminase-like cysteine peptidase [Rhizobium sp. CFBP 8762]|uniref:transglutaminase-like cysteine peptidase n=1 Tax=Rhizobium sp. CFBP 8762 TaxID=2775279 RepID=UPI00406C3734
MALAVFRIAGFCMMLLMMTFAAAWAGRPVMDISSRTNPPIGHYEFCKRLPAECGPTQAEAPLPLTAANWAKLVEINKTVNAAVSPLTDKDVYGLEEYWAYPTTAGDCEDFALLKRRNLIAAGFAPSNLLITVVLQTNGEGHAVLTVTTDRGDFVLDNMRESILLWSETEYTFLKRQAADNSSRWMKIQDGRAVAVGSVR